MRFCLRCCCHGSLLSSPGRALPAHPLPADCGEPAPKRKKTVTWAGDVPASSAEGSDGPQSSAEEPAGPAASAAPAAGGGDGGGDGGAAVVVLPQEPDSLFQELEDLEGALEHQGRASVRAGLDSQRLLGRAVPCRPAGAGKLLHNPQPC